MHCVSVCFHVFAHRLYAIGVMRCLKHCSCSCMKKFFSSCVALCFSMGMCCALSSCLPFADVLRARCKCIALRAGVRHICPRTTVFVWLTLRHACTMLRARYCHGFERVRKPRKKSHATRTSPPLRYVPRILAHP